MDIHRSFVSFILLSCFPALPRANTTACLSMHDFAQTYTRLQTTVELLQSQMDALRGSLDASILDSCGDIRGIENPYQFNLTYCSFEDDHMCNYTQERGDNGDFSLIKNPPDHTFGGNMGHSAYSYSYATKMTSRPFDRSTAYCVRFFYRLARYPTDPASYMDLFIKQEGAGAGYSILHLTGMSNQWKIAEVDVDPEYLRSRFLLEFSTYSSRDHVMLDDIMVYNTHCSSPGVRQPFCKQGGLSRTHGNMTSCYIVHIEPKTWTEAITTCKQEWPISTLVGIESATEQNYLVSQINANPAWSQTGDFGFWTTGNDDNAEGTFSWTGYGEKLNYTNWHAGQPNNVGGKQNCLLLQYKADDYKWGDVECSSRHPFICEMAFRL